MFRFVILLTAISSVLGAAIPDGLFPQFDGRIVGGVPADIEDHPWQISLQRSGSHSCGGSIVSEINVVTAAHCLDGTSVLFVNIRAGSTNWISGGFVTGIRAFKLHPNFNRITLINDIAVIRLLSPLPFGNGIQAIPLTTAEPPNGAMVVATGWGTLRSGGPIPRHLQSVELKIVRQAKCASDDYKYFNRIKNTMICATAPGKDTCQGDSGGPLVSGGALVGVASWGQGCAQPDYPGVYASVADLHPWLIKALEAINN